MRQIRVLIQRLRSLLLRDRIEHDLDREINLHLDQLTREYVSEGMDEAEARRAALRDFGPLEATKQECRDMRRVNWFEEFLRDLGYAWRSLRRSPAFTLTAILTIALGIGVNTAVFHLIYTVLLHALPFRDPARLVHIAETHPAFPSFQVAAPDFFEWQRRASSFEEIAAYTFQEMNKGTITGAGEPEPVQCVQASYRLFPMLGIEPILGRSYSAEEESGKAPVALLSETLWRRKYAADPAIIGRKIRLDTTPMTVIGVVSQRQAQPDWADVWMPMSFLDPALTQTRRFHPLEVIGRLKAGVSIEHAQAEMKGVAASLAQSYPETNGNVGCTVLPLSRWMTGEVRPSLLIAWAAVLLVLLLACANVAHLVLVRTVHRSREMAVRAALGAGSSRLTRFLLAENLTVAVLGGILGAILARAVLPLFLSRLAPGEIPRTGSASYPPEVILFGAAATLLCALLFALPAILLSRKLDLQQVIRQSLLSARHRSWFGASVIAAEIALAFVVVFGAGLLYRSFETILQEDKGFRSDHILTADTPLAFDWAKSQLLFDQRVAPRLAAIPGVRAVAAANFAPMSLNSTELSRFATRFGLPGQTYQPGTFPVAQLRWTTPEFFRVLGIPLKRGRLFTASDVNKPGLIINEALARRYFPKQDPVGQQLVMNVVSPQPDSQPILGVVGDVRDLALDLEPRPTLYTLGVSNRMSVLIRTQGDPAALIGAVRQTLHDINPDAAITALAPLDSLVSASLARRRFALELLSVFAVLAVLLTAIGVYGVVAYSLSWRTGEFAIRLALGARRAHLLSLVTRGFVVPAALGALAGAGLAILFARALRTQLYKLSPADPVVLAAAGSVLALLVFLSALRPAVRASSISPMAIPRE